MDRKVFVNHYSSPLGSQYMSGEGNNRTEGSCIKVDTLEGCPVRRPITPSQ